MSIESTISDRKPRDLGEFRLPQGEEMDTHHLNGYYLKTPKDQGATAESVLGRTTHPETGKPEFLIRLTPETKAREIAIGPECRLTIEMVDRSGEVKSSVSIRNEERECTLSISNGSDPLTGEHSLLMFFPPGDRNLNMTAASRSKVSLAWLDAEGRRSTSVLIRSGSEDAAEFKAREDYIELIRASSIVARGNSHRNDAQILISPGGHVGKLSSNGNVYIETPRGYAGPVPRLLRGEEPPISEFDINGLTTLNNYLLYYPGSEDGLESYRELNAGLYSGEYSWDDLTRMALSRYRSELFRSLYTRDADAISAAKIAADIKENRYRNQAERWLREIKAEIEREDRQPERLESEEPESAVDRLRNYLNRIRDLRPQFEPILTRTEERQRRRIREGARVTEYVDLEHRPLLEVIGERYRALGIEPDPETLRLAELLSNIMTVTDKERPFSQSSILTLNALKYIASYRIESLDPSDAQEILNLLKNTENRDSLESAWNRINQAAGRRIVEAIGRQLLIEAEAADKTRRRFRFWHRQPK